jgi:hypothetical protein
MFDENLILVNQILISSSVSFQNKQFWIYYSDDIFFQNCLYNFQIKLLFLMSDSNIKMKIKNKISKIEKLNIINLLNIDYVKAFWFKRNIFYFKI